MAERGSVEWWLELLDRYERERGQVTQMEFCEREGVSHNAFMYRMFGNWPHRRARREADEDVSMLPVRVVEPSAISQPTVIEADVGAGCVLRFAAGTDVAYMSSLLRRLAQEALGGHRDGRC